MKKFITYNQSLEILNSINISNLSTQKIFVADTLNRILAQDIVAQENSPAFKTSGMDGYAIKHEDLQLGKIEIIDKNPAGTVVESSVSNGTTIKTFTGSLMPEGSDTLIPIENVTVEGEFIIITKEVPKNFAVRNVGENYQKNELLIPKGTLIDFAQIGVMASLNIVQVEVYVKPTIAIASTGSEILDVGELQTNDAQIRSSNHLTLEAIAKKNGANVLQMGVVKDDKESIISLLKQSLLKSDIVVTTGGVSVGDYDFVKDVIKDELECEVLFQGVLIKPGQHILFAKKGEKFIIGLPGFAYSSTVTFILYILPLLFKFKGSIESLNIVEAIIDENFGKKGNKTNFTACNVSFKDGSYHINFEGKKHGTSAILTNMLGNPGLLIQEESSNNLTKGDRVKVILL
ncbi:molybdopterin molybdotransferase MoeA [Arcobacter sp. 15-2]|uniref:molybdopterin molybdotransferase MoeA n=1 Tax=Arcobacter sp. 15-2 TaxID=3374109 RepID=UPI00399D48D1